jgi:hypothetical protein
MAGWPLNVPVGKELMLKALGTLVTSTTGAAGAAGATGTEAMGAGAGEAGPVVAAGIVCAAAIFSVEDTVFAAAGTALRTIA